jgi:hypothetical protein
MQLPLEPDVAEAELGVDEVEVALQRLALAAHHLEAAGHFVQEDVEAGKGVPPPPAPRSRRPRRRPSHHLPGQVLLGFAPGLVVGLGQVDVGPPCRLGLNTWAGAFTLSDSAMA